jgi:hypothetical protein
VNTFNRVVLILLCLVLMFAAAAVTALAWGGPDESINWLRDAVSWLDERNTDGTKFIITTAAVVIALMSLTVLVIELYPRSSGQVKVTDLQVGDAVLSTAAIGQRVEEAVNLVPDVADVRATVRAKRKGVLVHLDLHVAPEANLASVIDEASEAARDILTNKVHVAMAEPPSTRIHYRELRLHGRPPRRPTVAESVAAEPEPAVEDEPEALEAPAENEEETAVKA